MTALEQARQLMAAYVQEWHEPEVGRLDAVVDPKELLPALTALHGQHWGYLATITGLDCWPTADCLEVLYHLCAGPSVLTVRVRLPREGAGVSSVCSLFPYASVFERELHEMFGLDVIDTPDTTRLFLPDDWPDDVYPLRKDARLE
jgi:Ni,Fe-hydrogenase III component G